jgi:flagellar hook-basal body complex protein FliE
MNGIQGAGGPRGFGIGGLGAGGLGGPGALGRGAGAQAAGASSFGETLQRALGEVEALQGEARDAVGAFLRGEPVEMHEVMAAAEEAGLALELLIEIRNKLIDAYRSVIQMQS